MGDSRYVRTTQASRKAANPPKYVHISVDVKVEKEPGPDGTTIIRYGRTPRGKGATARRSKEQDYMQSRAVRKEIKSMIRLEKLEQAWRKAAQDSVK